MDTARQVIRWALPGWVGFLFWISFVAVNALLLAQSHQIYLDILGKVNDLLLPLGAASIPIGFLIYQFYYWSYWYLPIPSLAKRNIADPKDRGREILSAVKEHVDFGPIFFKHLTPTPETAFKEWGPIYYKSAQTMAEYRENWHLADSVWYLTLTDDRYKNTAEFLEKRNQFLGDIYHSLGACYHALTCAYVLYLLTFLYISVHEIVVFLSGPAPKFSVDILAIILPVVVFRLAALTINSVVFILVFAMFRGGRIASFDALLALKHDVITYAMLNKPTQVHDLQYLPSNSRKTTSPS
jgi:hypothetical protein